jgi:hypothetical protein
MTYRGPILRVLGLGVAVIVLMAATQLLALSFEVNPLISRDRLDDLSSWIRDRPRPGPGILGGVALASLALWLVWAFVRSLGIDRRVITTRRRAGWTKLERTTLEDAVERRLAAIDRRNDLRVSITPRGKINLRIVTPDPSSTGPATELRSAIDDLCAERDLPCRAGRITVSVPRRMTARRRVR